MLCSLHIFRIYQDAEITFTKDTSGTSPVSSKTNNIGDDSKNLLDLSPGDVVFYVGGYPANFTVSKSKQKHYHHNVGPCLTSCSCNVFLCLLLILSLQIPSTYPCMTAASSSSPLTIKPSVFTTSAPGTRSTCRLRAKGGLSTPPELIVAHQLLPWKPNTFTQNTISNMFHASFFLISRYVPPVTSNYYEGTGYSRVPIDKQSSILLIAMSLYTRSENGLIAYFSHEVNDCSRSPFLSFVNLQEFIDCCCLFFLFPTQNNYFAVTMEKGVVFIHSNLLESPVTSNLKLFPVGVCFHSLAMTPLFIYCHIFLSLPQTTEFTNLQIIGDKVNGKMTVRVASKEAAVVNVKYNFDEFTELYVGGIPEALRERYPFVFLSVFVCFESCFQKMLRCLLQRQHYHAAIQRMLTEPKD